MDFSVDLLCLASISSDKQILGSYRLIYKQTEAFYMFPMGLWPLQHRTLSYDEPRRCLHASRAFCRHDILISDI